MRERVSNRVKLYAPMETFTNWKDLSFHSCRHTIGWWLSMGDIPQRVISEILGHSNTQVTEMYSHLRAEVMDRFINKTFEVGRGLPFSPYFPNKVHISWEFLGPRTISSDRGNTGKPAQIAV